MPTIVLTTSTAKEDIWMSYELKANCHLSKPIELGAFEALVKSINEFWLKKVILPRLAQ